MSRFQHRFVPVVTSETLRFDNTIKRLKRFVFDYKQNCY